jgi:GTPase
LKRTVTISNIEQGSIRLNEWTNVTFEFYGGPEFVKTGSRIFFKEQETKGVGEVIEIPDS